ncbi:MAG: pantetheine-phosphate adenylyltransferase [Rickettsiales bacterium]|jgi:pantetheine-phosphate adenylyltransferase|nr:pantetheine-phosphate adenylyltransferase [Rickettsiales bacterium]
MKRIAIYPGTFDPITKGHLDIVRRASKIVDVLIVAVAQDTGKTPLFTQDERVEMAKHELIKFKNVKIVKFSGLVANFFREQKANFVIRGIRTFGDFENEFSMAIANKKLYENYETLFMPAMEIEQFTSSTRVRSISALGGDISFYVSKYIKDKVQRKLKNKI